MKKIYFDGLGLVEGHFSGIGQYILGVLRGLDEIIEQSKYSDKEAPVVQVIIPYDTVEKFLKFGFKNITYKKFPLPFRYVAALWHRGKLPPIDLLFGRAVYVFPRFVGMPLIYNKSILVIYDLSYELHREFSDEGNAQFLSKYTRKSIEKTATVITISNSAKQEIMDFYNLDKSKIKLAYPAVDQSVMYRRTRNDIERTKQKYEISGDYILALSNLEPRKNLEDLIDSYCSLPKNITDKYALMLVGVSGWKTEKLFTKIIKKVEDGYNIIRPSKYVLDEDKAALISGATLLAYPSHYEGFGIPPVEALACGVPVIAANNSSLPEAIGDAGILVDITKKGSLAKSIEDTLRNSASITKRTKIEGPKQAEKFSWKRSAEVFLDAARELD